MRRAPAFAVILLLLAAQVACSPARDAAPSPRLLVSTAGVVSAEGYQRGTWFSLQNGPVRFVLPATDPLSWWMAQLWISRSRRTGHGITVRFDPDSGRMDHDGFTAIFQVSVLRYDDEALALGASRLPGGPAQSPAERSLAKGLGLALAEAFDGARQSLDQALSAGTLSRSQTFGALLVRGRLSTDQAELDYPAPEPKSDALLIAALQDFAKAKGLAPNSSAPLFDEALTLQYLGAYDEALAEYRTIAARWPQDTFWAYVSIGAVDRALDHYDQALDDLNQIVRLKGPQSGMAFHYHRGWTLEKMGRNEEAIEEFTAGLDHQPDYAWAFSRRACSLARIGRLDDALEDETRAAELMARLPGSQPPTAEHVHDRRWIKGALADLRAAAENAGSPAPASVCSGYWIQGDRRRERSPLLAGVTLDRAAAGA